MEEVAATGWRDRGSKSEIGCSRVIARPAAPRTVNAREFVPRERGLDGEGKRWVRVSPCSYVACHSEEANVFGNRAGRSLTVSFGTSGAR